MNKVLKGDALTVLKTLPSKFINCTVTSPPYWGLRDYGVEPSIWDGDKDCEHKWTTERTARPNSSGGKTDWAKEKLAIKGVDNYSEFTDYHDSATYSNFCSKCGAWKGSLGLEPTFELFIKHLCDIFDEVKRVLRKDGTCWVNLGDTYNNSTNGGKLASDKSGLCSGKGRNPKLDNSVFVIRDKQCLPTKSLCLIPQRFAIEMLNRGWILRNVIIWHKPNCMPSSAKDRFTVDFEYLFFFVKNKKYWFEQVFEPHTTLDDLTRRNNKYWSDDIADGGTGKQNKGRDRREFYGEQGRNKRTVWTIPTKPYPEAHFAVYPAELIRTCIKAGCPKGGVVLDPFAGSGTTLEEAIRQGKDYIGIELKDDYIELIEKRLSNVQVSLI